ncbi:MAG: hypothetical protein AAGI90_00500 [Chlamydiota bacterium]
MYIKSDAGFHPRHYRCIGHRKRIHKKRTLFGTEKRANIRILNAGHFDEKDLIAGKCLCV